VAPDHHPLEEGGGTAGPESEPSTNDPTTAPLAANLRSWDERVPIHLASRFYDVNRWLQDRPGPRAQELEALGDVVGLDLVHLQCHFGLDTLAWADAGAQVTGLDFSQAAIEAARELAVRAGLEERSTFVCANVYDAAMVLAPRTFDIVYVSLGALHWLPSVGKWADQVAALARPAGRLYLHDTHPLPWSLDNDSPTLRYTYFEESEPFADDSDETYTDADRPLTNTRTYEWNHSIGEVVTALIDRGFRIDHLAEHDWTVHQRFPWLIEASAGRWVAPTGQPRLPLTFTVVATRTD
jgi:SAM-dependent methyltransferase